MVADPILFRDLAYVFVAAMLGGGLAWLRFDRGELHSRHGGVMIGITLVEDLAVVALIVLIPMLGALHAERLLAMGAALLTAAAILVPFFYLASRIVPPFLGRVARTRNDELFLLVALAIALGAAALTQAAGLSFALGAFLAGLLINQSDYAHETLARLRFVPHWIGRARLAHAPAPVWGLRSGKALSGHVVLCGFGRVGSAIGEALETFGVPYIVIETDPDVVKSLRARGVPAVFGDATQRIILAAAQAEHAALVILTVPETDRARLAVRRVRALNPTIPILARAHDLAGRDRLAEEGAAEAIQPELETATTLIRHALERLSLPRDRVLASLNRYRGAMESVDAGGEIPGAALPRLHEVTLRGGSLVDQSLREAHVRERFGVTVVAVTRANGETVLHPTADTVLRAGDRLRLFGLSQQIDALLAGSEVLIG